MASSLVDDLVCSVCLGIFHDPHILVCGHNFCLDCLKGCVDGRGRGFCPECRCPFRLQEVSRHRILANLAQKARKLQLDEEPRASASSAGYCKEHEEPLKLFCRQDRVPICVICRDLPCHQGHKFLPTKDAVKRAQRELKPYLKPLKERLKEATKDKLHQKEEIGELKSCTEDIVNHISTGFAFLHRILHEKEKAIKKTVLEKRKKNLEEMQDALSFLRNDNSSLTEIITKVKAALESTDHVAFLQDFQELMKKAKDSIGEEEEEEEEEEDDDDEDKAVEVKSIRELMKMLNVLTDEEEEEEQEQEQEEGKDEGNAAEEKDQEKDEGNAAEEKDQEKDGNNAAEEKDQEKDDNNAAEEKDQEKDDNNAAEEKAQKADEEQGESSEEKEEYYGDDEKNVVPVFPSLKKFKVALDFEAWGKLLQGIKPREVN